MRDAAATEGSFGEIVGRGVFADVMAVRSAWQLGSFGVAAHAASLALTSGPRAGRPAKAASGGVVVYPGTTPVAEGWFTMPLMAVSYTHLTLPTSDLV